MKTVSKAVVRHQRLTAAALHQWCQLVARVFNRLSQCGHLLQPS